MIVWNTLNVVSAFATKRFALSAPPRREIASTIWFLAKNRIVPIMTIPNALNKKCTNAVRFAFLLAFIAAITAGVQEPIFAPRIKYRQLPSPTRWESANKTNTLTVTEELCTATVKIKPTSNAIKGFFR